MVLIPESRCFHFRAEKRRLYEPKNDRICPGINRSAGCRESASGDPEDGKRARPGAGPVCRGDCFRSQIMAGKGDLRDSGWPLQRRCPDRGRTFTPGPVDAGDHGDPIDCYAKGYQGLCGKG